MSRHRIIRDAIATHAETWAEAAAPDARVIATWNFEQLQGLVSDDDSEVIGVIVIGVEDIDSEDGSRQIDADVIVVAIFHFVMLPDSHEATANAADDTTESLRDHLRTLRQISFSDNHEPASRIRTTLPTPFDHKKLNQSATWAAMIETEYSLNIPNDDFAEPPV